MASHGQFSTRLHPLLLAATLTLAAILPLAAHAEDSTTSTAMRTITVSGHGEVTATPDMASIQTGVTTEADTARAALDDNTKAMQKVLDGLKGAGIAEKDLQTSQFSIYPVYRNDKTTNNTPKITGYRVTNQLSVIVRDLSKLGGILDQTVTLGANQMNGISFSIDDTAKLEDDARTNAVRDALHNAKLIAGAAGVAVGRIVSIQENGSSAPSPVYMKAMRMEAAGSVPVAAGEQTVSSNVSMTVEIE